MIYIAPVFFACISVLFAGIHANMIADKKTIKHGAWAALYLGFASLLSWAASVGTQQNFNWWVLIDSLCIRMVFFNLPLNRFRGLKLWYVSPELKNVTSIWDAVRKGKTIDWLHYKVFGKRVWIYMAIYLLAAIIITKNL